MNVGPCAPWPVIWTCDVPASAAAVTGSAVLSATEVLWALSGRRFGECQATLRPCRDNCDMPQWAGWAAWGSWGGSIAPALIDGLWYNLGCSGGCAGSCSCNTEQRFTLPAPVNRIVEVVVAGVPVATGAYVLEDSRKVVRVDGGAWPHCNDGSWTVTAVWGHEVWEIGKRAVGELACQLLKVGTPDCQLPQRVQTITREGVTMAFVDPQEYLRDGKTGLYLCDLFLSAANPGRLSSRPRVYSPDRPPARRWS